MSEPRIEGLTLFWDRPLSFVFFSALSPLLVLGGVALFFLALLQNER